MAIERIEINDFLVFKGEFSADFCPGVNVFIGGNGTGKTTLLRQIYDFFTNGQIKSKAKISFKPMVKENGAIAFSKGTILFVPTTDMLSHSKSLLALARERKTPFRHEELDILASAQLGEINELLDYEKDLLLKISKIISGQVVYENDTFYVVKETGEKIEFNSEASGFTKFGLLWKLIRNGLLRKDTAILWDEPENSLNPELMPKLVEILLELSRSGVQIFLATHSYDLSRYFDVRKDKSISVAFHNLVKENEKIICNTAPEYIELENNLMETASAKLFNAVAADAMGVEIDEA
jgi:AAA15 family ATPase/GTPase